MDYLIVAAQCVVVGLLQWHQAPKFRFDALFAAALFLILDLIGVAVHAYGVLQKAF